MTNDKMVKINLVTLGIQTKKIFGEYLNDVNINEICFNGDGSIWTQDFKSIWTEHKKDISYDEMMAFAVTCCKS